MQIAILGGGNIGRTLGAKWLAAGHTLHFGVRDPGSPKGAMLQKEIPGAHLTSPARAASVSDVVLFSTPSSAVPELATALASALAGKLVVDATNNFGAAVINQVTAIQQAAPSSRVYRAFNTLGWEVFARPVFGDQAVEMFFCGADGPDRLLVEELIRQVGVSPVWVGGLETLPIVDQVGALWVTLAFRRGLGREIALRLARR